MKRGEVWTVDFGAATGPEQAGRRPAILLQDDMLTSIVTTIVVIPLTTNLRRLSIPSTVLVPAGEGSLPQDSVALCYQIRARDKRELVSRIGELSAEKLKEIEESVHLALGM